MKKAREKEHSESEEVKALKGVGQPLVVACQVTEVASPREAVLHQPPPWRQDELLLHALQLHYFQSDTMFVSRSLAISAASSRVSPVCP